MIKKQNHSQGRKNKITKAVVAVAGSGTRFLPITKVMPKEMLPIIDVPILHLLVQELIEAGITDILFVTKWDKRALEDYFDRNWALVHELKKAGKDHLLKDVKRIADMANFFFTRQSGPYGNGTPVLTASSFVGDEPFVFAFGDDLVKSKISFTKQMIDDYEKNENLMMGVQEVSGDDVSKYGIVSLRKDSMEIKDIVEKPSKKEAPSQLASFGRYILNQDIINILGKTPLGKDDELWIVDAIRAYIKKGGVFKAKTIENGEWLTTGDPLNFLEAVLKYGLDRKDIGKDLKKLLKDLIK